MPELPEVETIARGLDKRVRGDVIESIWLGSKPEPLKSPAAEIARVVEHRRIAGVRRIGKHIVIDLESTGRAVATPKARSRQKSTSATKGAPHPISERPAAQWIVHLGMTGR